MAKSRLEMKVEGMTCQGCVRSIENKLSSVKGVEYAHVNLGAGKVAVEYDDSQAQPDDLIHAVQQLGFEAART